ncbi:cytochrome P450 [Gordonia sp. NPDC003504]
MVTARELFADEVLQNPYPVFEELLSTGAVHHLADQDVYIVIGFEAIREVLADPDTYSSNLVALLTAGAESAELQVAGTGGVDVLATSDPPAHTAHRGLVQPRFGQRAVAQWTDFIDSLLEPRIKQMLADGGGDWMTSVATTVPVRVIGHIIGLPEADLDRLAAWSDDAIALVSGVATPDRMGEAMMKVIEFTEYLGQRVDEAIAEPRGGLLDTIAAAVGEQTLTRDQATMFLVQLVTAGAESTTSLLGTAVRLVCADPALQSELRADSDRIPLLVEEAVRLESPFRGHFRTTTRATTLDGVAVPEGARLMLLWGASNRDSTIFDHPDVLDLDRAQPRLHHSFGRGIHFCIGAHLARLEVCRAIDLLLAATSEVTLAGPADVYVPSLVVRRLAQLELSLSSA